MCEADLSSRAGDAGAAARYERTADTRAARVERLTVTTTRPYSHRPYYPRVTKARDPDRATTY